MSYIPTIASTISLPKTGSFTSAGTMLEHAASNVASFWLDYSAKCIERNESVIFLSDCVRDLVVQECNRNIYDGIYVSQGTNIVWKEIERLAIAEASQQFEAGKYLSVKNRIADMNEAQGILKVKMRTAFSKQA